MNVSELPDVERARFNMIEQQIRPWSVSDPRVLAALAAVPRERYIWPGLQALAFADTELPIIIDDADTHETLLTPKLEARLAQALQLQPADCVLEIGTGSGFHAALLGQLARQVTSVEIDSRIAAHAVQNLQRNQVANVQVEVGSAHTGWGVAEYNAILLTGSVPVIPDTLKYQLCVGGRLVAVVGSAPIMTAVCMTRSSASTFEEQALFDTLLKPLHGFTRSQFKF